MLTRRRPEPNASVLHGHPLLPVPTLVATIWVGLTHGPAAAQITFLIAGVGTLAIESSARVLVRAAWNQDRWPPSVGDPAALGTVAVGAVWAAGWSLSTVGIDPEVVDAIRVGARAAWAAAAIQFLAWWRSSSADQGRSRRESASKEPVGEQRRSNR